LATLEDSYFFFDLPSYRHFVEPRSGCLPKEHRPWGTYIQGEKYFEDRLAIPVGNFASPAFGLDSPSHKSYMEWLGQLVKFAQMLQDERLRFYCSN
jgi:hypothetical protein